MRILGLDETSSPRPRTRPGSAGRGVHGAGLGACSGRADQDDELGVALTLLHWLCSCRSAPSRLVRRRRSPRRCCGRGARLRATCVGPRSSATPFNATPLAARARRVPRTSTGLVRPRRRRARRARSAATRAGRRVLLAAAGARVTCARRRRGQRQEAFDPALERDARAARATPTGSISSSPTCAHLRGRTDVELAHVGCSWTATTAPSGVRRRPGRAAALSTAVVPIRATADRSTSALRTTCAGRVLRPRSRRAGRGRRDRRSRRGPTRPSRTPRRVACARLRQASVQRVSAPTASRGTRPGRRAASAAGTA